MPIEDPARRGALFGTTDRNLRLIRAAFDVRISARDTKVHISGPPDGVHRAARVFEELQRSLRSRPDIPDSLLQDLISESALENGDGVEGALDVFLPSAVVVPRGEGQRQYVDAIYRHDLTCCVGPAGTGKTYLAVAVAVSMLKQHRIQRIVLVRPAVEAGEKLGYLPGDMQAKVNPYLRPLFDAMHDMMTFDQFKRFVQTDVVEVVPLAFMRGRTLNNSVIILDEAQNATIGQMLMFLTRLGHHSKMIVTGDDSQSDLRNGEESGFVDAVRRLQGIEGVAVVRLTKSDIVRHPLVQRVVEAYERGLESSDNHNAERATTEST
ncbi:MAG: PhoH family protein [Planctomycetes bacterium]|nr:PhoH family protein [Planctomycetota bacterium]